MRRSRFSEEEIIRVIKEGEAGAKSLIEMWRKGYNQERPHGALGYLTPLEFAWQSGSC